MGSGQFFEIETLCVMGVVEETAVGSLPKATRDTSVFVGKIARLRTHCLESASAFVVGEVQIRLNTPQQAVRLVAEATVIAEGEVTDPRFHTKVVKPLDHVVTRHFADVKVKTDNGLSSPAEPFKLEFHKVTTVQKRTVKRATFLSYEADKLVFVERFPRALNHFFAEFAILGKGLWLGAARSAEVAKEGVGH